MLSYKTQGSEGPTIVLLHWLGGSGRTWTETVSVLASRGLRPVTIDLPGFGDSVDNPDYSVESMAENVLFVLRTLDPTQLSNGWLLGGHSMGGKVAAVLARQLVDDVSSLPAPRGLTLISPSPPCPEPMKDSKREQMLASLGKSTGDADDDRKRAASFLDDNLGKLPLGAAVYDRSVDDVLRMSRRAFRAWLTDANGCVAGSKEDWSARVGQLPVPALIVAGSEDAALGPDAQKQHTQPHFSHAKLVTLAGCGHLAPIERPLELAEHILSFAQSIGLILKAFSQPLSPAFQHLLDSQRTSPATREVLVGRLEDMSIPPHAFNDIERHTLGALIDTVIPYAPANLGTRLEQSLIQPQGDGWRFDDLPVDLSAWQRGLVSLDLAAHRSHGVSFSALTPGLRRDLLLEAQKGNVGRGALGALHLSAAANAFTATQMQHWFEDARSELTRLYVSDPRTLDRIGFTGFADDPSGFTQIRLEDQHETSEERIEPTR